MMLTLEKSMLLAKATGIKAGSNQMFPLYKYPAPKDNNLGSDR